MHIKSTTRNPAVLLLLLVSSFSPVAAGDLSIGRMQVSIWSEYDDPGVLAIYEGRFEDATRFPIKTSFLIPKGSIVNDACSLSHEGKHFCQLYTVKESSEFDEVQVYLPYPNFYLSFHFTPFDAAIEKRAFSYRIKSNHSIDKLEVDIQQPLRSTEFHLSPAGGQAKIISNANHFYYAYDDIAPGREHLFNIEYLKQDRKPSIDIKYSRMTGPKVFSSHYETQRNFRVFVYVMFGSGVAGVGLLLIWLFRERIFPRQVTAQQEIPGGRTNEISKT
jgi:hypothetical protein